MTDDVWFRSLPMYKLVDHGTTRNSEIGSTDQPNAKWKKSSKIQRRTIHAKPNQYNILRTIQTASSYDLYGFI